MEKRIQEGKGNPKRKENAKNEKYKREKEKGNAKSIRVSKKEIRKGKGKSKNVGATLE